MLDEPAIIVFMNEALTADLIARWYEYWRLASGGRAERKALEMGEPESVVAAHRSVADLVEQGGSSAVQAIAALARASPAGDDGMIVGVGPIEDLLYTHGDDIVEPLLDAARRAPALARALAHVSLADGSLSESSLALLGRYRG